MHLRVAILYAGSIWRVSGTSERVLQIAKGLADLGVQVTLSGAAMNNIKSLNLNDLEVIEMPDRILKIPNLFIWVAKLIANSLTYRYDVVQIESFSLPRTLALLLLLRPFNRKFIMVFHDKLFKHDPRKSVIGRLQLLLQRILLILFDASITPGLTVKKFFQELHGQLACEKIVVIPNGVPNLDVKEDIACSYLREKYNINTDSFIALFFGSMTFKPNYEAALQLYKISDFVSREFKKTTGKELIFIVAGLNSEILPRTANYIPLGFVNKLDELLALPDVIVLPHPPSYSGPHVKTIYAFLSKKPVVATEDAIKDMPNVVPGKHFLLFDIQKPDTLLKALIDLYYNRELGKTLALNAYLYSRKISWKYISWLHLKLYRKLLQ